MTSELIEACRHLAAVFDETLGHLALDAAAHRRSGVNPYSYRTTAGLYLEFYYGSPSRVWTPGGAWHFSGGLSYTEDQKEIGVAAFMARVTTELHKPGRHEKWGNVDIGFFGPVYKVLAVDGHTLEPPGAVIRFSKDGYREMRTAWAELAEGWPNAA